LGTRIPAQFVTLTGSASCGPRGGRSAWRAFYRRLGDVFVVAAVGSEAEADPRDFKRAVAAAEARMEEAERNEAE
jgi:hypothetical protein